MEFKIIFISLVISAGTGVTTKKILTDKLYSSDEGDLNLRYCQSKISTKIKKNNFRISVPSFIILTKTQ